MLSSAAEFQTPLGSYNLWQAFKGCHLCRDGRMRTSTFQVITGMPFELPDAVLPVAADCEREPGGRVVGGRQRRRDGGAAVRARARPARQPVGDPALAQRIVLGAAAALHTSPLPAPEGVVANALLLLQESYLPFTAGWHVCVHFIGSSRLQGLQLVRLPSAGSLVVRFGCFLCESGSAMWSESVFKIPLYGSDTRYAGGGVAALGADRHGEQRWRQHPGRGGARGTALAAASRRVRRMDGHVPWHGLQAADISRCWLYLASSQ